MIEPQLPRLIQPTNIQPWAQELIDRLDIKLRSLRQASVSENDGTFGYLSTKLVAGANVTLTVINPGGDEQLSIASTGGGGVGTHPLLDSTVHTDTVTNTPTRGSLIKGNSTPAWDEFPIGTGFLKGDGTDASWAALTDTDIPDTITLSNLTQITTRQHSDLQGIGANDHHNQSHVLATTAGLGPDHTTSGLTTGQVLRASGAAAAAFAVLQHGDLGGVSANQHHNQSHVLADTTGLGADHTTSGLTAGQVLRASGATAAAFAVLGHGDLNGVTANQHHNQSHVLATNLALGADHTISGTSAGQVLRASSSSAANFQQLAYSDLTGTPPASPFTVQRDDVDVDTAVTVLDFNDQDAAGTLLSSSPAGEVNINMELYMLATGRPTGRNSYVLSSDTSTAVLSGGNAGNQTLDLQGTTSSTRGQINMRDAMNIYTQPPTNLDGTVNMMSQSAALGSVVGAGQTLRVLNVSSTLTLNDNLTAYNIIRWASIITANSNDTWTLGSTQGILLNPTYTPVGASGSFTGLTYRGLVSNPIFTNAGTGNTISSGYAVANAGTINTNWTATDWGGLLVNDPGGSGTVTNLYGVNVAALTRGSTITAAFNSAIAAASGRYFLRDTGGAQSQFNGKITTYDSVATAGVGMPSIVAVIDNTGVAAARTTAALFTASAAGFYRISFHLTLTTAGSVSSTLGSGVNVNYSTGNGGTAVVQNVPMWIQGSTTATTDSGSTANTVGTTLIGSVVIYCNTTAVTYDIGYTSNAGGTMQYAEHIRVERLG